jgi:dienelactone hydrolase
MYPRLSLLVILVLTSCGAVGQAAAADVAIMMPGSGGIHPGDFLVRNEDNFKRAGIRTIVTTSPSTAAQAVAAEATQKRKSVIVGMSRGAADAAEALAAGARPAGVVLVSGVYGRVIPALRNNPDLLPATLVVHHARDICKFTLPGAANEFVAWSRGKARVHWINTTGEPSSNPCNARGAHGFFRQDGPAVAAIVAFIKSR